jgi:hypothetical protein
VENGRKCFGARQITTVLVVACALAGAAGSPARPIQKFTRVLTHEEVLAAIQSTLRANGSAAGEALGVGDVQMSGDIDVTESAPRLQVTQIQSALDGATSRVLVWVASEPRVPPFWVRLDRAIHLGGPQDVARRTEDGVFGAALAVPASPGPSAIVRLSGRAAVVEPHVRNAAEAVLVKAGDPVALIVEANGLRIQGTGIPLERGRKGDEVRIRAVPSGKVVVGTVVGKQTVRVNF